LFFVGTSGAMGAVVASSAVLGGALLAAIGGVLAVGLVGALVARVIHQSDAEFLQEHVDEGHILLFVRLADAAREQQVLDILTRQNGIEVKMYEVPFVAKPLAAVPPGPLAVWA
jgi:outer membrane lipoprotein SlyB